MMSHWNSIWKTRLALLLTRETPFALALRAFPFWSVKDGSLDIPWFWFKAECFC
jgi:hypothetical protein